MNTTTAQTNSGSGARGLKEISEATTTVTTVNNTAAISGTESAPATSMAGFNHLGALLRRELSGNRLSALHEW